MPMYSVRMTNPSLCDRLGGCVEVCPEGVWQWMKVGGRKLPVPASYEKCTGCLKCVRICPHHIIEVEPKK
jgi:NAD-dependent dihydropyrimidine dehydrogenase PreA subunit